MATLALGAVFAAAGAAAGSTAAAASVGLTAVSGAAIGFSVGTALGDYLFAPVTKAQGPRANELAITGSAYGSPIPQAWGAVRLGGQVVWAPSIEEHANTQSSGGGKGGGGGGARITTYTYSADFAVLLCDGPIVGVRRIWADANIIYDRTSAPGASDVERLAAAFATGSMAERITIYRGTETQLPDPLLAADPQYATTGAPAYRGRAYIVFEGLQLEDYGNRRPNITVELYTSGSTSEVQPVDDLLSPIIATGVPTYANEDMLVGVRTYNSNRVTTYTHRFGETGRLRKLYINLAGPVGAVRHGNSDDELVFVANTVGVNSTAVVDLKFGVLAEPFVLTTDSLRPFWACRAGYLVLRSEDMEGGTQTVRTFRSVAYHDNALSDTWTALRDFAVTTPGHVGNVGLSPDGKQAYYAVVSNPNIQLWRFSVDGTDVPVMLFENTDGYVMTQRNDDPGLLYVTDGSVWIGLDDRTYQLDFDGRLQGTFDSPRRSANDVDQIYVLNGVVVNVSHALAQEWWSVPADVTPTPVSVERVINDVAAQVGANVDASSLTAKTVAGYIRTRTMSARAAVEPLQQVHQFDFLESAAQVRAVTRGGASVFAVEGDTLVSEREYAVRRAQDVELPRRVVTQYISAAADYQPGTQQAQRIVTNSSVELHVDLPVVLTDDEAAGVAEVLLYNAWSSRESMESLAFPPRYARLEPCDIVTLRDRGNEHRLRLTGTRFTAPGMVECQATIEDASIYTTSARGGLVDIDASLVRFAGSTDLWLLDTHLLRTANHAAGVYAAASGGPGWRGAQLFASPNEQDWTQVATLTRAATRGELTAPLAAGPVTVTDSANTLAVRLYAGTLSGTDDAGFLAGVNAALVGDEVITFRDAALTAPDTYDVSVLGRGRRGTEQHLTHAAGERFVLLDDAVADVILDRNLLGRTIYFRAVSLGQRLDQALSESLVYTHHRAKPFAPAQLNAAQTGTGTQYRATWVHRSRTSGEWVDGTGVPATGVTDQFRVQLWRAGALAFSQLVAASEVTLDALPGDELRVAQVTDEFGVGYESTVILT